MATNCVGAAGSAVQTNLLALNAAIEAINTETEGAVRIMDQGTIKLQAGVDMTKKNQTALADIIVSAQEVVFKIQTITATTEQQSIIADDVVKNSGAILQSTEMLQTDSTNVVSLVQRVKRGPTKKPYH